MRVRMIAALAALTLSAGVSGAEACGGYDDVCAPSVVVWPVFTETGRHIGVVEAPVQPLPHFGTSHSNGQPVTVVYNNPDTLPGSVDPYLHLVPLPHVKRSSTIGAYPVGY